jgi:hypothetical protein
MSGSIYKVIVIDGTELRVQVHVEVALGKSVLDGGLRGGGDRWKRMWSQLIS